MKAKFTNSYRKNGNPVFVFRVSGSATELEAYRDSAGSNLREDEAGNPLFFTTRYAGETINLVKTASGSYIADTSAFAQAEGMLGNFASAEMRAAMAGILAKQFLGIKDTETVSE